MANAVIFCRAAILEQHLFLQTGWAQECVNCIFKCTDKRPKL